MGEFLKLKKSNCKNCYKCIRHCPVKSIRFSAGQAHIVSDECILCGQCFVVCPQNAKEIADDTEKVRVLLGSGVPVYASVAPSFVANYDGLSISALEKALVRLGFAGAEETAVGATIVKREYERALREEKPEVLISSCCHSINLLIQKYYPALLPYLSGVLSPMLAHAQDIRRRHPDAKVVFIGPCVAKKDEADHYAGYVDAVLTFEELSKLFAGASITPEPDGTDADGGKARFFPTTGGILKSMTCDQPAYTYLAVDGTENCIAALHDIERGGLRNYFIEMSACYGSCVGGPVMEKYHRSPLRDYGEVAAYAKPGDFAVGQPDSTAIVKVFEPIEKKAAMPSEAEIQAIFRRMGKTKPEDELNCGSCGYDTCRLKAVAVHQGKADYTMCLPFLKDRAENFSDTIISNTPNGVLVLNESLEVQQINKAACQILNIRMPSDVLGEPLVRIMDPKAFLDVRAGAPSIRNKKTYLAEYRKYVEQTILYDREYHVLMCLLRDVTAEETVREEKERFHKQTIEVADKVVDKQMRIVQEIASLLGETAAETKIALTKLKESIRDE